MADYNGTQPRPDQVGAVGGEGSNSLPVPRPAVRRRMPKHQPVCDPDHGPPVPGSPRLDLGSLPALYPDHGADPTSQLSNWHPNQQAATIGSILSENTKWWDDECHDWSVGDLPPDGNGEDYPGRPGDKSLSRVTKPQTTKLGGNENILFRGS